MVYLQTGQRNMDKITEKWHIHYLYSFPKLTSRPLQLPLEGEICFKRRTRRGVCTPEGGGHPYKKYFLSLFKIRICMVSIKI